MSLGRISWSAACALCLSLAGLYLAACSDGAPPIVGYSDGGPNNKVDSSADPCASPNPGCACEKQGEEVDCGTVYRISGNHVDCSPGHLTCGSDSKWSACVGASVYDGG